MPDATPDDSGRYAYDSLLDDVLHEKHRLGILTALVARPGGVAFTELVRLCALTDGNLSRHLTRLAEAGLIEIRKGYDGRRPLTTCRITAVGRRRFRQYLTELEQVLREAVKAEAKPAPDPPPGLATA